MRTYRRLNPQIENKLILPSQASRSTSVHSLKQFHHTLGNRTLGRVIQTKLKDDLLSSEMGPLRNRPPQQTLAPPEGEQPKAETETEAHPETAVENVPQAVSPSPAAAEERDEETVVQSKNISGAVPDPSSSESYVNSVQGGGEPLTKTTRDFFEPRFRQDFSDVRVHSDASAASSAHGLNAMAYTVERDVVFGAGNYAPETTQGKRLLAHELAHVVQQRGQSPKQSLKVSNIQKPMVQRQPGTPRRVEGTVSVSWIDDDVEFYHRVINATASSRNYRGIRQASLWQPLHDPIFAMYRRLGLQRPALREGQRVSLRVSVWFDPTVFHGQVTDGRVETEQAALLRTASITGVLTPRDNFAGRSNTRFGLAEVVDLSFTAGAGVTAASLGGLRWFNASGNGTVTGGDDGQGVFTAAATPGSVQLELRAVTGLEAGRVVSTHNIQVIQPSGAVMQKDSRAVKHTHNYWGVGFCGESFLRPTNVSFRALQIREGRTTSHASGFLRSRDGVEHPEGSWFDVLQGNNTTGCQIDSVDSVRTADLPGPYSDGDFLWRIPWHYRVGTSAAVEFTIADQHATSDSAGTATIQKIGSPVFSKVPSDPTVDYDCY